MIHWGWMVVVFIIGGVFGVILTSLLAFSSMRNEMEENRIRKFDFRNRKGFTLIELLVSIVIAMVIMGAMFNFFINQSRSYASNEVTITTLQDTRAVVASMITDLRLAGYKTSTSSFCGIVTATDKSIRVLADLNQDGDTSDEEEDIAYAWIPDSLELTKNGSLFLDNVSSLVFSYTLLDGSVTSLPADLAQIRKITMAITIQSNNVDPLTHTARVFSVTSDVTPRNLGL
jgi:prepilin-type N-terminal cleavage/methylation domain-containing protein